MHEASAETLIDNVFRWVELDPPPQLVERLAVFADFLAGEAAAAGGIGPSEVERLWPRHIGDSLAFLVALAGPKSSNQAASVVDIGSGVGLPAIPLALALPEVEFTLVDRSARRCFLARRAARILEIGNVEIIEVDANSYSQECDAVVSRASFPPGTFAEIADGLVTGPATGVVAASHGRRAPAANHERRIIEVPSEVLGGPVWLIEVSLSGRSTG